MRLLLILFMIASYVAVDWFVDWSDYKRSQDTANRAAEADEDS